MPLATRPRPSLQSSPYSRPGFHRAAFICPLTRPSGRSLSITHRHIKNNRLAAAGWIWAFAAAANCEPAREHYRRRREHGDRHGAATRHLFNKLIGQIYCCLQHGHLFDDAKAFTRAMNAAA
jgi:hypothetical protein